MPSLDKRLLANGSLTRLRLLVVLAVVVAAGVIVMALPLPASGMQAAPTAEAPVIYSPPVEPGTQLDAPLDYSRSFTVPICVCVSYQGHGSAGTPQWVNPITLTVYKNGTNQILGQTNQPTDAYGKEVCTLAGPLYLDYRLDVKVKNFHTLSNIATSLPPITAWVNMGLLLEGDANDDDSVGIVDYSTLRKYYGQAMTPAGKSPDFNTDGVVDILDFSLLRTNYGLSGPNDVSYSPVYAGVAGSPILMRPAAVGVTAKLVPASVVVPAGAAVPIDIVLESGTQPVDGADIYLDFDPEALHIVDANGVPVTAVTPGTALPEVIQNSVDNTLGHINFSAGIFSGNVPSGKITLGRFYVSQTMAPYGGFTAISFSSQGLRWTKASFAGESVLASTENGQIKLPTLKLWLPAVLNDAAPVVR